MREAWLLSPWTVRVAVVLGLLTVAIAGVGRLFTQYSQDVIATLISWLIGGAVAVWFTSRLLRGRNWARIVMTVLAVAGGALSLLDVFSGIYGYTPLIYAQSILHAVAVVLLWLPPSWAHFAPK